LVNALKNNLKGGGLQKWFISAVNFKNKSFAASGEQHSQGIPPGQHGFHHRTLALLQELLSL